MEAAKHPSALARYTAFLLFFLLSVAALAWFFWSVLQIVNQITSESPIVLFDKGALYMLGAGVGLIALAYGILQETILKKPLTEKDRRIISNAIKVSIVVMFLLPQVIHYPTEHFLEKRHYDICEEASYQWLLYRRIAYALDLQACQSITDRRK